MLINSNYVKQKSLNNFYKRQVKTDSKKTKKTKPHKCLEWNLMPEENQKIIPFWKLKVEEKGVKTS